MSEQNQTIEYIIEGADKALWEKLQAVLLSTLEKVGQIKIDPINETTLKDEVRTHVSLLLQFTKDKLSKPGIDIAKTIAEIHEIETRESQIRAETRKTNAEAALLEVDLVIKLIDAKLRLMNATATGHFNWHGSMKVDGQAPPIANIIATSPSSVD